MFNAAAADSCCKHPAKYQLTAKGCFIITHREGIDQEASSGNENEDPCVQPERLEIGWRGGEWDGGMGGRWGLKPHESHSVCHASTEVDNGHRRRRLEHIHVALETPSHRAPRNTTSPKLGRFEVHHGATHAKKYTLHDHIDNEGRLSRVCLLEDMQRRVDKAVGWWVGRWLGRRVGERGRVAN